MPSLRLFLALPLLLAAVARLPAQEAPSYAKHVRPFLAKYCSECHNAKAHKGGLDLDSYKALRAGGDSGFAFEPGKADASELMARLLAKDESMMPPKKAKFRPTKAEIARVRAWIASGAKDDGGAVKIAIPDVKPRVVTTPPITALAFQPRGGVLVVARGKALDFFAADNGAPRPRTWRASEAVSALAFAPGGAILAIATGQPGSRGTSRLLSYTTGSDNEASLTPIRAASSLDHADAILDLAIAPDGKTLATASYDTRIKIASLPSGTVRHTLTEHSDVVHGIAFSPDGKQLASCSADRAVKVWDVETGKLLYTLGDATDWLYAVAWSPDGKRLAAGGVDKSIRVYEPGPQGAKLVRSVFAHEGPVLKLAFAPDSQTLYSIGQDRVVKAWDARRMVERKVYERQPETVLALAISGDGKRLALGRYDGAVVLLDAQTGRLIATHTTAAPRPVPARAAAQAKPALPIAKKLTPDVGRAGQTLALAIAGQHLGQVNDVVSNIPGAVAKIVRQTPASLQAEVTLPATARAGVYEVRLKGPAGTSAPLRFTLDAFALVPERDAGSSPATGQTVSLPVSIAGTLDRAGDGDYYRFEAARGQSLGVQLVRAPGVKLDPVLQITDLSGHLLAQSTSGHLGHTFAAAGHYAVSVRDREYRGGPGLKYRLHLGEIPVVTAVSPLGLRRGGEADVRLEGVFLDAGRIRVKVPTGADPGSKVALPVTTRRGAPLGVPQIVVGEFPDVAAPSRAIPVPGTANGRLAKDGQRDIWTFPAKKGQRLVIETEARRLGSDLDSTLEILDTQGKPVPRAVLRCQAKTFVTFRDHDSAGAGIRIDSWGELAANDYLYVGTELMRIQALPGHPDADCAMVSSAGRRLAFLDTTPTHHAQNVPMYRVTLHPPGTTFPPNGFPVFALHYRNDDGGPGYGRDSRILFDPPADGTYTVRLGDARGLGGVNFGYRLTIRSPRPSFTVRFTPPGPAVWKGGAVPLTIAADRLDGYDGPIAVRFEGLPPGLSAPATTIEPGTFSTTVALYADASAKRPARPAPLKLIAEAVIDGSKQAKEFTGATPSLRDPGDLTTTVLEPAVSIKPGGRAKLTVRIERRNGFKGRVPLEVRGLPHGVRVLDIGLNGILVNEGETQRVIAIEAESWVPAGSRPFVVLSRREGTGAEHAARPVRLIVGD